MSLNRFIYYSAVISGWAGFLAWGVCEMLFLDSPRLGPTMEAALTCTLVGLAVGVGLNGVAGVSAGRWHPRYSHWLVASLLAATAGGTVGAIVYSDPIRLPRAVGFLVMGLGIGCCEGIYERSAVKIRNGLIGGGIGGFLGGLAFDLATATGSDMPGRAVAFVTLSATVGLLIGLTQVVLKRAWLTVLDGFRPGRQLILSTAETVLGRGDHLALPFIGQGGRDLESEHLKIVRGLGGKYVLEDNGSRIGTRVNSQRIQGPIPLSDGDVIRLGGNLIRFNQSLWGRKAPQPSDTSPSPVAPDRIASPPPVPKSWGQASSPAPPPQPPPHQAPRGGTPRIPPPPPPPVS